jgi:probable HAF family extracellular repeat protein
MIDLGTPFPGLHCEARAIDATGGWWGAGTCCDIFNPETLKCEGEVSRTFEFRRWGAGWITLPSLGSEPCVAATANSAGWGEVSGGCRRQPQWQMNAARWMRFEAGVSSVLHYLNERYSVVNAHAQLPVLKKNSNIWVRQYVGAHEVYGGDRHAFVFRTDSSSQNPRDIGTLGGKSSEANAVNESGNVVGVSETASGEQHAFGWSPSQKMFDLGTIGRGKMSVATGINSVSDVVGYAEAYSTIVGFIRLGVTGQMVVLPPPEGAWGSAALGISNKGHVVGVAITTDPASPLRATMWVLK